ncbi:MAG TPA: hypothetical protein VF950_26850, partial [Planctomycetota bacterium]
MISTLALLTALAAQQTSEVWTEIRFHRVHLRNGNFVDGTLVANEQESVTLRVKTGDIEITRDLIDKVEYVKMRSYKEKPADVPPPTP